MVYLGVLALVLEGLQTALVSASGCCDRHLDSGKREVLDFNLENRKVKF